MSFNPFEVIERRRGNRPLDPLPPLDDPFSGSGQSKKAFNPFEVVSAGGGGFNPFEVAVPSGRPEQTEQDLEEYKGELEGLAQDSGVLETTRDALVSGVQHVSDFISRINYSQAGFTQEIVRGNGFQEATQRAAREFFHGLPGVTGERLPFEAALKDMGVSEGPGIQTPLGKITLRGVEGLALDILTDPTTYMTFGAAPAVKFIAQGGKVLGRTSLNKAGLKMMGQLTNEFHPKVLDLGKRFAEGVADDVPFPALGNKKWLEQAATADMRKYEIAHQQAGERMWEMIQSGEGARFVDRGGFKMFGQTVIPGEVFGRYAHETGGHLGKVLARHDAGRWVLAKGDDARRELDGLFNEVRQAARKLPGFQNFITKRRDVHHEAMSDVAKYIYNVFPKTLDKITIDTTQLPNAWFKDPKMSLREYALHVVDNPEAYPIELIPEGFRKELIDNTRGLFSHAAEHEIRLGLLDPRTVRKGSYLYHAFMNSPREMAQLGKKMEGSPGLFSGELAWGPHSMVRAFGTLDEGMAFASDLKAKGEINFDLKPDLDIGSVIYKRMDNFYSAYTAADLVDTLKRGYGLSTLEATPTFLKAALPGLEREFQAAPPAFAKAVTKRSLAERPTGPRTSEQVHAFEKADIAAAEEASLLSTKVTRDQTLELIHRLRADRDFNGLGKITKRWLAGQPAAVKATYFLGRARTTTNWEQLAQLMKQGGDEMHDIDPALWASVKKTMSGAEREGLNSFGESHIRLSEGRFAGWIVPREVAEEIVRLDQNILNTKPVGLLLKTFDLVNDMFKVGVTIPFPAFHFRNHYSNVAQSFVAAGLAALNPLRYWTAARLLLGREGTLTVQGRRFTFDEVRKLMVHYGIAKDFDEIFELKSGQMSALRKVMGARGPLMPAAKRVITGKGDFTDVVTLPLKAASATGGSVENMSRVLLFVKHLQDGYGPTEAAARVKKFLFDYQQLSPFERNIMTRLFPFYKWTKKNMALTLEELARQPGKYSAMFKAGRPADMGPEADALPWYLKGSMKVKLTKGYGQATFITGIDLPAHSAIDTIFNGSVKESMGQMAGMLAPAIKTPLEWWTHHEFFSGRDLRERQRIDGLMQIVKRMPPEIHDWLEVATRENPTTGELEYTMNGTKAYLLFRSWAHSRFLNTWNQTVRADPKEQVNAVELMTGFDTHEVDLSTDQKKILRRRIKLLEQRLIERGVLNEKPGAYQPRGVTY
jgi:hypothetical protein